MPGKRDVHGMRYKREEDMPSKINPAFIVVSTTLFIVGVAMLIIVDKLGDECKMEAFDKSSYHDSAKMGNLPKWFNYTGTSESPKPDFLVSAENEPSACRNRPNIR